jgi:hypothetical protein
MMIKGLNTIVALTAMMRSWRHEDLTCCAELEFSDIWVMHVCDLKIVGSLPLAIDLILSCVSSWYTEFLEMPNP